MQRTVFSDPKQLYFNWCHFTAVCQVKKISIPVNYAHSWSISSRTTL